MKLLLPMMMMQSFVLVCLLLLRLSMADHGDIGSSVVQQQQKQPKQPQDNIIIISNRHHHRRSRKLYRGKGKGYGYTHPFHPPEADDEGPNNDGPGESSSSGSSSSNGRESDHDEDESWSDDWSDDWNDDWNDDEQAEDDDDNDNDNTNGKKKKPESESSSSSSSTPKNNNNDDDKKDSFAGDNEEDNNKDESSESPSTASPSASNNDKKDDENEESSSTTTTTTTTTTSGNQVVNQEGEESTTTTTTTTSGSNNNDAQEEEKEAPHENQDVVIVIPSNKDEDDNDAVDEENAQESDFNPQPVNEDSPGDGNDENEDDDDDDDNHDNDDDDNNDDDDGDWPTAANDFAEVSGDSMLDACVNACARRVYETDESVFVPFEYQLIIPADHDQEESIDLVDAAVQEYLTRELIFSRCHEYIDPLILQQCPMDDLIGARRWLLLQQQQQRRRIDEWDLQAVRGVGIGFTNELLEGCSTLGDRNKVCSVMEGTSVIYLDEELAADVDHAAIIEDIALMIYKSGIVVGPFSEIQVNFKPPPGIAPDKVEDGDGDRDPGTVEKKENLPISVSGIVILIVGIIGVSVGSGYYMVKRNKRKGTRGIQLDESFDETGAPTRSSVTKLSTPPALTMGSTADRDVEREQEPVFDTDDSSNCDIGSPAQILADLQRQEHEEAFKEMSYEVEFPSHVQPSIPDLRPFSPKVSEELDSQHEGSSVYMSPRSYNVGNTVQL